MPVTERMPLFVSNNKQTLGELFLGFLEYYAHKFMFIENSISIRTGGILPTDECRYVRTRKNDSRMWKYLCIEEPFDLTNTARSVYDELVFEKVRNVFKDSCKLLKESKNLEVLFSKS
ncbi:Poly(A) RNA polymerase gld-2-like protein A [Armadillidium vulgare]|nr:Poly(A) RNA polymerase gld-2-like protein A [Armadillidium vulgare]